MNVCMRVSSTLHPQIPTWYKLDTTIPLYPNEIMIPLLAREVRAFSTTSRRLGEIFNIQDNKDFETKVLKSKDIVVVDFYADWCGPCKLLGKKLERRIGQEKNILLAKINVDNLDELAAQHEVSTIPHVVGFKNGKAIDKFIGNKDEDVIDEFIKKLTV